MNHDSQHTRALTPPWARRPPPGAPPRPPLSVLPAGPGQGLAPVCGQRPSVDSDTPLSERSAVGGTWAALAPGCRGLPEAGAPAQERGLCSHCFQHWHLSRPAAGPALPADTPSCLLGWGPQDPGAAHVLTLPFPPRAGSGPPPVWSSLSAQGWAAECPWGLTTPLEPRILRLQETLPAVPGTPGGPLLKPTAGSGKQELD